MTMDSTSADLFFTSLVDMIPVTLYRHTQSEAAETNTAIAEESNSKYFKHRKLPLTVDERKAVSKRKITEKYSNQEDDDTSNIVDSSREVNEDSYVAPVETTNETTPCSLEDLRHRLQARILGLKTQRASKKPVKSKAEKADKKKHEKDKKKRNGVSSGNTTKSSETNSNNNNSNDTTESNSNGHVNQTDEAESRSPGTSDSILGGSVDALQFSNLFESKKDDLPATTAKPGGGGSKKQRLTRLLEETEKKRDRLKQLSHTTRELNKGTGKLARSAGEAIEEDKEERLRAAKKLKNELWNDVMKSAVGDKSLVVGTKESEAKLKKAIKRIDKKKQKSAEKWADRLDAVKEDKDKRIKKREDNIQSRKDKKNGVNLQIATDKDSKSNHTREESPRAGFEGKKNDILNKDKNKSKSKSET